MLTIKGTVQCNHWDNSGQQCSKTHDVDLEVVVSESNVIKRSTETKLVLLTDLSGWHVGDDGHTCPDHRSQAY